MRSLWSGAEHFEGQFIEQYFDDATLDPKPIQRSIPVWVGGLSEVAMQRAARLGDAWHPNTHPLNEFRSMVARFRKIPEGENQEIYVRISLNTRLEKTRFIYNEAKERI